MTQEWTLPLQIKITLGPPVQVPAQDLAQASAFAAAAARGPAAGPQVGQLEAAYAPDVTQFEASSLTTTNFSWRKALSLALASHVAYMAKGEIERIAAGWKMLNCQFFDEDDTQGFICTNNKVVLLAFRGSEAKLGDWLGNLNAISTSRPYGSVHRGFLRGFQVVQARLEAYLANYNNLPVVATGHSLGGALAVIAAAEWKDLRTGKAAITSLYTFGQPATGFRDMRRLMDQHYSKAYFRFVNDTDLVTMIPPFYKHSGRKVHFTGSGAVRDFTGSSEREAVGLIDAFTATDDAMLSEADFDQLRAEILLRRVEHLQSLPPAALTEATAAAAAEGAALGDGPTASAVPPLPPEKVEEAVQATLTQQPNAEGFLPSITDHFIRNYIKHIAAQVK